MREIRVFPDYCSSGLWENHVNMDESYFEGVLTHVDFMALKYWHKMWVWHACDGYDQPSKLSDKFWVQWNKDGRDMVDAWNMKQSEFKFVYQGS